MQQIPTIKINLLKNNEIYKTYVFCNNCSNTTAAATTNETSFFNDDEITFIHKHKINVHFIAAQIYPDDTIMTTKIKILEALASTGINSNIESMYLFCRKQLDLNLGNIYNILTQNGKIKMTPEILQTFINNVYPPYDNAHNHKTPISSATPITLVDFITICNRIENHEPTDNTILTVNYLLGNTTWTTDPTQLVSLNPFNIDANEIENLHRLQKVNNNLFYLPTNNNNLLMDTGAITNNTLYLCLANDVLPYITADATSIELALSMQKDVIKSYYPLLWDAKIFNTDTLLQEMNGLKGTAGTILKDTTLQKYFNVVNMFYGVYQQQTSALKYKQRGIESLHLCIHPRFHFKLSLDTLFKTLHATKTHPLIKYNPSIRQENIYRIYTDKISTDGRKIPSLKKTTLLRIIKEVGNTPKTVTIYVEYINNGKMFIIVCEITENGEIYIRFTPSNSTSTDSDPVYFSIDDMDKILTDTINPVLENIQDYFEQNGYKLTKFKSITEQNIEILQLTYNTAIQSTATLEFGKYKNCITPIFNNETSLFKNMDNVINFRFKRVSNFNKTTSQEAFIIDKIKDGYTAHDIATLLMDNFKDDLTYEDAINMVNHIFGEQQLRKIAGRRITAIMDNPGFSMTIQYNPSHDTILLSMTNINNIQYLHTVPIYIDTLLRLATAKNGNLKTDYPTKLIDACCGATTITATTKKAAAAAAAAVDIVPNNDAFIPQIAHEKEEEIKHLIEQYTANTTDGDTAAVVAAENEINEEEQRKLQELMAMYGDMDDDDDDDDDDQEGGAKKAAAAADSDSDNDDNMDDEDVTNVEKIKLKRMFQNRMKKRDPVLFINSGKNYSRECQSSSKRQPIALTADELKKIQKQYPNFLRPEDIISYGSDPKNKINYICPRYWCLKTNMPIDSSEMKEVVGPDGKKELVHPTCGRIIPNKAKSVTPGHYVYEFYGPNDNQYPGLIPGKNKGDSCLPCCFTKWNTDSRLNALKKCLPPDTAASNAVASASATAAAASATEADDAGLNQPDNVFYIKGPEKVPLPLGRWGHLPMQLQFFFREMNIDCQVSKLNPIVKQNHPCLMRHGVESDTKQSFLACMSNVLYYGLGNIKKISELKAHIIATMTLDDFITYQNGDLVTNFTATATATATINEKYKKTRIYQASQPFLNSDNDVTKQSTLYYLHKIIGAFENFTQFLSDDDITIDYTYLWDIFAQPNKNLFPKGINLVIFDILNNDITNNIQMVCPTNHYSGDPYDPRKPTCFIVKQYEYYEPIYSYTKLAEGKIQINKTFFERDKNINPAVKLIINNIVKPFIGAVCKPLPSMPNVYHTKTAPILGELLKSLDVCNITPISFVANFNNKIIGVVGRNSNSGRNGHQIYIPCYPSTTTTNTIPTTFMTDIDLWQPYDITVTFLTELAATAKSHKVSIPCMPTFQVIEDSLIVGILTETNQFIQISQPIAPNKVKTALPQLKNGNYMLGKHTQTDAHIAAAAATGAVDTARVDYVDRIKKETAFYNIFRNTIKILMNSYENGAPQIKTDIIKTIDNPLTLYGEKCATVGKLVATLVGNRIQFTGDDKYYKTVDKVATCVTFNADKCKKNKICALGTGSAACNLILPIKNLTTGKKNKDVYYTRFVDELVRYNHIRKYIIEPYNLYSFGNKVTYNLNEHEILLMQSLITPEYFDGLVPAVVNKYIANITYDQIEPIIHQPYDNEVTLTDQSYQTTIADIAKVLAKCAINEPTAVSHKWEKCFGATGGKITEITYTCGMQLVAYLIQTTANITLSSTEIKKQLGGLYVNHGGYRAVISVLGPIVGTTMPVSAIDENVIFMDNYKLNAIDLWLLVDKFKLPAIFITSTDKVVVAYKGDNVQYCVIWIGSGNKGFSLATSANQPTNPLLTIDDTTTCFKSAIEQYQAIHTLLAAAKPVPKPKGRPRKRIPIIELEAPAAAADVDAIPEPPINNMNNDTMDTIEHVEILAPVRKRGRPRKRIVIENNSGDDYEYEIGVPVLKTNKDHR